MFDFGFEIILLKKTSEPSHINLSERSGALWGVGDGEGVGGGGQN